MQEYSTLGFILSVEQTGECDGRVTLFTRELGKITARAKSLYKSVSKLAAHVQPLTLARVRLVGKRGIQLTDALIEKRHINPDTDPPIAIELLSVVRLISALTHPHQPDEQLWQLIISGQLVSRELLRVLGFDPAHARCHNCQGMQPAHFLLRETVYLCKNCFKKTINAQVISMIS